MPNWTYNTITGPADVLSKYINDEDEFDFNKIRPMPKSLNCEKSSNVDFGVCLLYNEATTDDEKDLINKVYKSLNMFNGNIEDSIVYNRIVNEPNELDDDKRQQMIECANTAVDNYKKYGFTDWYEWRCHFWGTKWNASDTYYDEYTANNKDFISISFNTAWDTPEPIWKKIFSNNPNSKFLVEWQNEDGYETHYFATSDGEFDEIDEKYNDDDWGEPINNLEIDEFRDKLLKKLNLR